MKSRQLIFFHFLLLSIGSYAQIVFELGYYVDNSNHRVDCLIRNMDWKSNPVEFEYKVTENDDVKTLGVGSVKEFSVLNTIHKYYRHTVEIDRSTESTSGLSNNPDLNPVEEQLFLRSLIEGNASLLVYEDKGIIKFFYQVDGSPAIQLLYKRYKTNDNRIGENNKYQQQLWTTLKCESITMNSVESMVYRKQALTKFFIKYNECHHSDFSVIEVKDDKDWFNLAIRPALNKSSLEISNEVSSSRDVDFGSQSNWRLGVEFEFVMPFKGNKLSAIIEPTYQYFKSEKNFQTTNPFLVSTAIVDYKSLEVPIGIRYYMFLSKKSKLFINGSSIFDLDFNSKIDFVEGNRISRNALEIGSKVDLVFGLGFNYNNRFNLEARVGSRHILNSYNYWNSTYKSLSLICGIILL